MDDPKSAACGICIFRKRYFDGVFWGLRAREETEKSQQIQSRAPATPQSGAVHLQLAEDVVSLDTIKHETSPIVRI